MFGIDLFRNNVYLCPGKFKFEAFLQIKNYKNIIVFNNHTLQFINFYHALKNNQML